jgi:cytochrome c oxidase assembly protein subunit 15
MAIACAVLVLAITTLSAFIRLSRAGLGCEPWPQCRSEQVRAAREGTLAPPDGAVATARVLHRITAVAALLLIIGMLMTAFASGPASWREGRLVLALLALALFLAVLGRATADSRLPAVVLGNLLAGFAMLAVSWRLAAATAGRVQGVISRPLVWAALVLLVAQIALGGLVSAGHAGLSCPQLTACDLASGSWQALNPWHEPVLGTDPTNAAAAPVQALHRAGAALLIVVLVPLGVIAWRRGRPAGAVLLVLVLAQAAVGVALVAGSLPLALALAHNVVAALLLAALVSLLGERAGAQEKASGSPPASSAR